MSDNSVARAGTDPQAHRWGSEGDSEEVWRLLLHGEHRKGRNVRQMGEMELQTCPREWPWMPRCLAVDEHRLCWCFVAGVIGEDLKKKKHP